MRHVVLTTIAYIANERMERTLSNSVSQSLENPPPMSISRTFLQPIAVAAAIKRLQISIPLRYASNSRHGVPTWKLKPCKFRPRSFARCIKRTASSCGSQPNFDPSDTGEFLASQRMRITILSSD